MMSRYENPWDEKLGANSRKKPAYKPCFLETIALPAPIEMETDVVEDTNKNLGGEAIDQHGESEEQPESD